MRFFNTEGPVRAEDHYAIPPLKRDSINEILNLIRDKRYFVLHAPRQTGKTSALIALRDLLNGGEGGSGFRCVDVNVEVGQVARDDVQRRFVIECKVLRDSDRRSLEATVERGVEQTLGYMEQCNAEEGHLVVIDRRGAPADPCLGEERERAGRSVAVWTL